MTKIPRPDPGHSRTWTVGEVLRWTTDRFKQVAESASPRLDAEVLLAHCLGVDRIRLYIDYQKPLTGVELVRYRQAVRRRLTGEPVAHITGEREFWSLTLEVDATVLVPRPETELVVEAALEWLKEQQADRLRVVDVGTGSGAIAVALAREMPSLRLVAVDKSAAALAVAQRNLLRHSADVTLMRSDLLEPFVAESIDLVVANPPYIESAAIDALPREVSRFDPHAALDGGPDGLDVIRALVSQASTCLRPGGALFLEVGAGQAPAVTELLVRAQFSSIQLRRDLADIERVVVARKCASGQQCESATT
jgi:release factor glutamine methyltransferase